MSNLTLFLKKMPYNYMFITNKICYSNSNKQNLNISTVFYKDNFSALEFQGILIKKTAFYSYRARFAMITSITREKLILSFPLVSALISIY